MLIKLAKLSKVYSNFVRVLNSDVVRSKLIDMGQLLREGSKVSRVNLMGMEMEIEEAI